MPDVRIEFTVFPFQEGPEPPPHVLAAIEAIRAAGLAVEVGPFGTAVSGEAEAVVAALAAAELAAIAAGATRVASSLVVQGGPTADYPHMGRALGQLIAAAEARMGKPLGEMSRDEKQQVVRFLDGRGAFELRRSVETVADALGVSRFTVYNYLESSRDGGPAD